jgi:hypothetical protein
MAELSKTILKILLLSLGDGFEEKYYESEFKNCHGYLRINNYSPERFWKMRLKGLKEILFYCLVSVLFDGRKRFKPKTVDFGLKNQRLHLSLWFKYYRYMVVAARPAAWSGLVWPPDQRHGLAVRPHSGQTRPES